MMQSLKSRIMGASLALVACAMVSGAQAQDKKPIVIGFSQSLTGALSVCRRRSSRTVS